MKQIASVSSISSDLLSCVAGDRSDSSVEGSASSPDETAAKFASEALTVIGEEVPYKLAQQVPSWTVNDVQYWVRKVRLYKLLQRIGVTRDKSLSFIG